MITFSRMFIFIALSRTFKISTDIVANSGVLYNGGGLNICYNCVIRVGVGAKTPFLALYNMCTTPRQSALILRCFLSRDASNLKFAFYAYVRPILEYASPIWSPHTQKDIDLLENVQRRYTKSISKLHSLPYTTRLSRLNIPTLSSRRTHIDLCTVYRILHNHTHLDPPFYFTLRPASVTRGHPFTLLKPLVRLDSSKFSFFSRTIDLWNSPPFAVNCFCWIFLCFQGPSETNVTLSKLSKLPFFFSFFYNRFSSVSGQQAL